MPSLTRRLPTRGRSVVRSLLASAMVKTGPDVTGEKTPGEDGFSRTWQKEGFDYYDQVGELHYCVDPDTEILTRDGWRRHDQIAAGDSVLTLDHEGGSTRWEPIEAVNRFDHDGPMVKIERRSHSSFTTLNHRWPTLHRAVSGRTDRLGETIWSRRWRETATLTSQDYLITGAPCAVLPVDPKWSDALVELVAWFFTEGTIACNEGQTSRRTTISQSLSVNPTNVARIRAALTATFGPPSVTLRSGNRRAAPAWREYVEPNRPMVHFQLNHEASAALLVVAPDRIVDRQWVLSLTRAQLDLFIFTAMAADGSRQTLGQRDPARLDAFELALILTGRSVTRSEAPSGMHFTHWRDRTTHLAKSSTPGHAQPEQVHYEGVVWCPTTPSGTWLARRNGSVWFTGNSATFVGSCLSRVRLTIGVPDEEGNPGPAFDDKGLPLHPDAAEALVYLRDLRAQIGGQSALMRAFGLNLFLAGEGYLTGIDKGGTRSWEVLSVEEIRPSTDDVRETDPATGAVKKRPGYERKTEPNAPAKPLPAESYVVRVWRSHPRYAWLADAPTKAVRDILDELVLLTRQVRSQTLSRLWMNGVWVVPEEIDYPDDDNASDESPEGDPLTRDLIKVISAAIADPSSAAGQTPFVFRAPYDYCDEAHLRYIKIDRTSDDKSVEKRAEAVLRLARGLDLPVEVVLGHAQTTFCVDDETEALTDAGWCGRGELAVGDRVLTLDHATGIARWEPVQALNEFDVVDEPMLEIETKSHSSLTTAGHRWPVVLNDTGVRRWRTSGGRSHQRLNMNNRVITAAPGAAAAEPKWSDDFVELVAWHYTEGHISHGGAGVITQAADVHPEKCARIRAVLHRLVGAPVENLLGQRGRIRAWAERVDASRPMARFVLSRELVGDLDAVAPGKIPSPEFIRSLTSAQLELFLHVCRLGDGWVTNTGTVMFAQRSSAAVDPYEMAAILSGRTTSRWARALGSGRYATTVMHYCSITDRTDVLPFKSPLTGRGHRREWRAYTGKVWCPTTATGTWLARRHGRIFYTGNSNAWQIDESLFKSHIEPLVETVVDCLTIGYLRVVMPETELVIHYDPNELVAHPDRTKDAAAGHAAFVLSNSTYRKAIGFTDADAPDDEEMAERIEIAQAVKAPSYPGMGPADGTAPGVGPVTNGDTGLAAAAEVSVLRALQRVGARIRSKANGNQAVREIIRGTPDDEVAAVLGPAMVASIVGDEDLFRSEFTALRRVAARAVGAGAAEEIAKGAETDARTRLYKAAGR